MVYISWWSFYYLLFLLGGPILAAFSFPPLSLPRWGGWLPLSTPSLGAASPLPALDRDNNQCSFSIPVYQVLKWND